MSENEVSDEQADEAMKAFAEITGTDEIFAQTILQDVNWNLQAALEVFLGQQNEEDTREEAVIRRTAERVAEGGERGESSFALNGLEVSLLSWNIDGLDGSSLPTRMLAVYKIVKSINADFVFLQEVVEREIGTINKLEKFYNIHFSNRGAQYFTAILTSKMLTVLKHDVHHYENSRMGRTLQTVEGMIGDVRVFLLNTHLESMAEHSNLRRAQFTECMERCSQLARQFPQALIFFGGDLNLRDDEVSSVPGGFADAWLAAGSPPIHRYTWDTRKNDNKSAHGARCRFDRIFWKGGQLSKVEFSLQGQQRIRSSLCFPSDHWAVHANFSA